MDTWTSGCTCAFGEVGVARLGSCWNPWFLLRDNIRWEREWSVIRYASKPPRQTKGARRGNHVRLSFYPQKSPLLWCHFTLSFSLPSLPMIFVRGLDDLLLRFNEDKVLRLSYGQLLEKLTPQAIMVWEKIGKYWPCNKQTTMGHGAEVMMDKYSLHTMSVVQLSSLRAFCPLWHPLFAYVVEMQFIDRTSSKYPSKMEPTQAHTKT